jgi:hypothetical protein
LGRMVVNVPVAGVQCDEIWGFIQKKPPRQNSWVGLPGRTSGWFANPLITRTFRERRSSRTESFFRTSLLLVFRSLSAPV